jgi:ABC-type polysaccharide/polyol phosphate transport system ATPase subunit
VPDILILDEVLSVGDATFTGRCEERIQSFHDSGATVLIVSHAIQAITKNCTRCIWLDDGQMKADGKTEEVVNLYLREHGTEPGQHAGGRLPAAP